MLYISCKRIRSDFGHNTLCPLSENYLYFILYFSKIGNSIDIFKSKCYNRKKE